MTNSKSDLCFNWFFIQDFDLINFQYFINHKNICIYYPFRKHKMLGYLAYIGLNGILKSLFSSSSNPHFLFLFLHMALCLELLVTPTLLTPDIWLVEKVHDIFSMESIVDRSSLRFENVTGRQLQILQNLKWWSYVDHFFFSQMMKRENKNITRMTRVSGVSRRKRRS